MRQIIQAIFKTNLFNFYMYSIYLLSRHHEAEADADSDDDPVDTGGEATALPLGADAEAVWVAECALASAFVAEATTLKGTFGRVFPGGPNVTPRFRTSPVSMS
jgi:hypothetical protein